MRPSLTIIGLAGLCAHPALARDYCPDRPGLDTPACTVEPGRVSAEMSAIDWTRDSSAVERSDTVLIGDLAVRIGVADHAEFRIGWTPFGHVRVRDKTSGAVAVMSGVGDVTLGIKRNLIDPDGSKMSIALLPSVTLPVGGKAIGAGDWGAGLQVPASVPLGGGWSFALTPEVDAAVDADGHGRHLAYGSAGGFSIAPLHGLNIALEAAVMHDDDPTGKSTQALAGIAAGLMIGDNFQLDAGSELGLNQATPGLRLYFGLSRRF